MWPTDGRRVTPRPGALRLTPEGSGAPERHPGRRSGPASRPASVPASPPSPPPPRRRPPPAAATQTGGSRGPAPRAAAGPGAAAGPVAQASPAIAAAAACRWRAFRSGRRPRSGPAAPDPPVRRGGPPRYAPARSLDLASVSLPARGDGRQGFAQFHPQSRKRLEDVSADRALRAAHDLSDLRIGEALVVAEHHGRALTP